KANLLTHEGLAVHACFPDNGNTGKRNRNLLRCSVFESQFDCCIVVGMLDCKRDSDLMWRPIAAENNGRGEGASPLVCHAFLQSLMERMVGHAVHSQRFENRFLDRRRSTMLLAPNIPVFCFNAPGL